MTFLTIYPLLRLLTENSTCEMEYLVRELACDDERVLNDIQKLRELGVNILQVDGDAFSLGDSVELLDGDYILSTMNPDIRQRLLGMTIEPTLDSTNSALQRLPEVDRHGRVILAEHQSSGRGRRGNTWVSPFAKNLYLSLGWRFDQELSELACLPLVVALATANALTRAGLSAHCVKWPNDLLLDGRKLSGCLVEMQADNRGPCYAALGVGINVNMPVSKITDDIDQAWIDLNSRLPSCSRNDLVVLVLEELVSHLVMFSEQGFAPLRKDWEKMDGLFGKQVGVGVGERSIYGTAVGIDDSGALLLDTGKETIALHSGEVRLHKTPL